MEKLRFKDFKFVKNGVLSDICEISTGKFNNEKIGNHNVYGANGIIGKTNKISHVGRNIIVGRVGSAGKSMIVDGKYYVSDNAFILKSLQIDYTYAYIEYLKLEQYSFGSVQKLIKSSDLKKIKINIISNEEKVKIGEYFSNLDTVINNKQCQLELMEKYKEDLLDKIFNQKIRFKDENGCDYPEWKKAKLGDYITIFPKSKHPASVGLISGKYNFFTTSNKNLYLNEFDIDGDYLIIGDGGVANFKHYNGKFSISDHCWLAKFENLNNNYVKQFLTYKEKLINDLLFQGTGLRNLSRKLFLNFEFPLIDIKEQEKIENLFSNLDLEINVLKNSIKNLKKFKIDMLEKMF